MSVPASHVRLPRFDNIARVTTAIADNFDQFGAEPLLIKGLGRPLDAIDRRLQAALGSHTGIDADLGVARLSLSAAKEQLGDVSPDVSRISQELQRASSALEDAEAGTRLLATPDRHLLVGGLSDKALPAAAWAALESIDPYRSIVRQEGTPLQPPLMKLFAAARRLGVGEHVVIGAHRIPKDSGAVFAPNHTGLYDMTLLDPLRATGDLRPMKVAGYTKVRQLIVDPLLARAGAFTVEAGSKPVAGTDGVTKGDMGIAVSAQLLKDRHNVVIFPQGNIEPFDTVSSLYDGAARASLESGAPIVPVANWGSNPAARWMNSPKGVVTVIGDPIDVSSAKGTVSRHNISVVTDELHLRMLNLLDEARSAHQERFGR